MMNPNIVKTVLARRSALVEAHLESCLEDIHMPERLRMAMNYSLLAGGKRLRPVLCLSSASLFGLPETAAMPFALAIEMIHTYSLIHDDLPAMDDDDLRRGRPSCHRQFDEATAILAGDALLTDAFLFMASSGLNLGSGSPLPAGRVLAAIAEIAAAAGSSGMVGGQVLDMECTGQRHVPLDTLRSMHELKTGAMIRVACTSGAILAGSSPQDTAALHRYGEALGVAFQIQDDILDVTGDTATLGKPAGSDAEEEKTTYPSLVGLDESRRLAAEYADKAASALAGYTGEDADFLRGLANLLVTRNH